ncbi:hypothetical protein RB596_002963 [Gaeumannomyces avenae]
MNDAAHCRLALEALAANVAQTKERVNAPQVATRAYKFPTPDRYDGKEGTLKAFLTECKGFFAFYYDQFNTEPQKVAYAATRLNGKVKEWFEPVWANFLKGHNESKEKTKIIFTTFARFEEEITSVFGQVNKQRVAERKLLQLKQKGAASVYVSEFQRLVNKLDWTDQTKIAHFYNGLRDDVKDEVSKVDKPKAFSSYITIAVKTSNRLYERRLEKKGQRTRPVVSSNKSQRRFDRNKTTAHGSHPGPMDFSASATHQGQRKRKFQNPKDGKCFKCGKPGHIKRECPEQQKQGKMVKWEDKIRQAAATRKEVAQPENNGCPGPAFSWTACSDDSCNTHQSDKDATGWYPRKRLAMTRKGKEPELYGSSESGTEEDQAWIDRHFRESPDFRKETAWEQLLRAAEQDGVSDASVLSPQAGNGAAQPRTSPNLWAK